MEANTQAWLVGITLIGSISILLIMLWFSLQNTRIEHLSDRTDDYWKLKIEVDKIKRRHKIEDRVKENESYYQSRKVQESKVILSKPVMWNENFSNVCLKEKGHCDK